MSLSDRGLIICFEFFEASTHIFEAGIVEIIS
jgi:hypothetical protein